MATSNDLFGIKTKRCPYCGEEKELNQYYRSRSSADGLQSYCKECQRRYREKHPEKEYKQYKSGSSCLELWNN